MSEPGPRPSFEIDPQGVFSLEESARFIGAWHEAPAQGPSQPGHLHLAFLTDREWKPVGLCLTQAASGRVHGDVYGDADPESARAQAARILSLDMDGRGWAEIGHRDPVVGRLQRRFPGFRPVNWSDAYEAAAWCILSTRVAMRQAQGVKDRMCRELGHEVDIHGHRLWAFPDPQALAELESFNGLFEYAPGLTVTMTVFLFALAGIPPLAGWFAKFEIFRATANAGTGAGYVMAVFVAVNSVIALFYYARIAQAMWMQPAPDGDHSPVRVPPALVGALAICVVAVVAVGVYPQLVARVGDMATFALG